jgi:hypothetical protein
MNERNDVTRQVLRVCLALSAWVALGACTDGSLSFKGEYAQPGIGGQAGLPGGGAGSGPTQVTENGVTITITEPTANQLYGISAVKVKGTAQGVSKLTLTGGGQPQEVEVVNGAFEKNVVFPQEGRHSVVVAAEGITPVNIPILVDLKPPVLQITSPQRGAFAEQGIQDQVLVQGRVTDTVSGVKSVTVAGQPAQVAQDGSFSVNLPPAWGANVLTVEAKDVADHGVESSRGLIYGNFEPWETLVDKGLDLRLRSDLFALIGPLIGPALGNGLLDPNALGGGLGGGDVELQEITYQRIDLNLTPQYGYFDAAIFIHDLYIALGIEQRILFFDTTIDIEVSGTAILYGKLYVRPNGQGGVAVQLTDAQVDLQNFDFDLDGLLEIVDGLIEGPVRDGLITGLSEALNGVNLDNLGGLGESTFDLFGRQAALDLYIQQLDIDPQGMSMGADMALTIQGPELLPSPGRLSAPGQPPTGPDPGRMMRISLADDLVNQLLGNIWRVGGLNIDVGALLANSAPAEGEEAGGLGLELNAGTVGILAQPEQAGQGLLTIAPVDTPVGLRMRALLPPVFQMGSFADGVMKITVADLLLDFSLNQPGTAPLLFATVASQLEVYVNLGFDEAGKLTPAIKMNVKAEIIDEPLYDIKNELFESGIEALLSGLPDQLLSGDGLAGLAADPNAPPSAVGAANLDIRADGSLKDYLSIYLDLVQQF